MVRNYNSLISQKFGTLTVIAEADHRDKSCSILWFCKCDCGRDKIKPVTTHYLVSHHTRSCGCARAGNHNAAELGNGIAQFNSMFTGYMRNAKIKGVEFSLSRDEFRKLSQGCCFYCGVSPLYGTHNKSRTGDYIHNGIDRVDNSKGYVINNVVPCCKICNIAKHSMTQQEFYDWITKVYKRRKKPSSVAMVL